MDKYKQFSMECRQEIMAMSIDRELHRETRNWMDAAFDHKYPYHFEWLGRPIIQYPQDIIAMQEIIWRVKPDLIVETGIAHGGSLVFYASMLEIFGRGRVLGIDIDIRAHNRKAIENHPMAKRIEMIEGSSIDGSVADKVREFAEKYNTILVALDSHHSHAHVLQELQLYSPLVTPSSYCVVFDTIIEHRPLNSFPDRPWDVGNNPKTAVREFLKTHPEFEIDKSIPDKLQITVAPDGYLRRIA